MKKALALVGLVIVLLGVSLGKTAEDTQAAITKHSQTPISKEKTEVLVEKHYVSNNEAEEVYRNSKKHEDKNIEVYYEKLSDRYDELILIGVDSEKLSEAHDILLKYADTKDLTTAYNDLKLAEDIITEVEYEVYSSADYIQLNKLYDSSVIMLQKWDEYKEYANFYNMSIPDEVQKYLDEAVELSGKIGETDYFELSLEDIDLMQGRVNEITTYLEYKYNEMVELSQSDNK